MKNNMQGSLNGTHFGGIKQEAWVIVNLGDFPYNSELFGLGSYNDPCNVIHRGWWFGSGVLLAKRGAYSSWILPCKTSQVGLLSDKMRCQLCEIC